MNVTNEEMGALGRWYDIPKVTEEAWVRRFVYFAATVNLSV